MLADDYFARDNGSSSDRCSPSDPRSLPYDRAFNAAVLIDGCLFKQYGVPYDRTTHHLDLWRENRVRSHLGLPCYYTMTAYMGRLLDIDCTGDIIPHIRQDRKSTRLNSSHVSISYAV